MNASDIVKAAQIVKTRRIDAERTNGPYDWTDADSLRDYIAVLESVSFWTRNDGRSVVVRVADTDAGRPWSHAGAEILDCGASDFDLPDTAIIEQLGATTYALSW